MRQKLRIPPKIEVPKTRRSRGYSIVTANASSYNLFRLLLKELELDQQDNTKKNERSETKPLISSNESFEQIKNMISLPLRLEYFITFGFLTCLNSLLRLLVILPLRLFMNSVILLWEFRTQFTKKTVVVRRRRFHRKSFNDLIFIALILLSIILCNRIDTSRIYHNIRAQSSIKLYVLFGVLEISDKLLSTVGQDLLNYSLKQNFEFINITSVFTFTCFFALSVCYLSAHTIVLIYQTIALNVAANSYSNSLLTLLLSNQFAEIKTAVFKKLDREGIFQMSCSDIVERFQLLLMLSIISLRNLVQIGSTGEHISESIGLLPYSIRWNYRILGVMLGPTTFVIGSELLVDWVKHSYVCKFNKVKSSIYNNRLVTILSSDVIESFKYDDADERIQQRLGLPLPALFVLFIVMSHHSLTWLLFNSEGDLIIPNAIIAGSVFVILLLFKLLLELTLLKWSNSIKKRSLLLLKQKEEAREKEREKEKNKGDESPLSSSSDYIPGVINGGMAVIDADARKKLFDENESLPPSLNEQRDRKDKKSDLSEVTRYQMFSKRIW